MECFTSMTKTIGLFLAVLALVLVSAFCTMIPRATAQIAGWAGVAFFGVGLLAMIWQLFRSAPIVVLDDRGIRDFRSSVFIEWAAIESVWVGDFQTHRFLFVQAHDEEKVLAQMTVFRRLVAKANRGLGYPPIAISFAGLSPGLEEAWAYIKERHGPMVANAGWLLESE